MYTFLLTIHILVCILLTIVILLQSSKGGGLAGTFGGSSMGAVFGGRGTATFLKKVTTVFASLFLLLSLVLALMTRGTMSQESVVQRNLDRFQSSPARGLPQQKLDESGTLPPASQPQQSGSQSGERQ